MILGTNKLDISELSFLLYFLRTYYPTNVDLTPGTIKSYKFEALKQRLISAETIVKHEALPIYYSLCEKLGVKITKKL